MIRIETDLWKNQTFSETKRYHQSPFLLYLHFPFLFAAKLGGKKL